MDDVLKPSLSKLRKPFIVSGINVYEFKIAYWQIGNSRHHDNWILKSMSQLSNWLPMPFLDA